MFLECAAALPRKPVLSEIPSVLEMPQVAIGSPQWGECLSGSLPEGITRREVLLRWLMTRAIVDQGSDIVGVEIWHLGLITECYMRGIRILHNPIEALSRYDEIIEIADEQRKKVIDARADVWVAEKPETRSKGSYTPFNVDGMRGGTQAHWFLSARLLPGLFTALLSPGGLTRHVFGKSQSETPSEMARRLRQDSKTGLGWSMGDKACDLFAKWAIGTFRLGAGLATTWEPADCPLPMDQRVGRVLMRSGFMDEFFDVSRIMGIKSNGFTSKLNPLQDPPKIGGPIPKGPWHLTVMNFRRNAKVKGSDQIGWLIEVVHQTGAIKPDTWGPQEVLSLLCRSYNESHSEHVTPVELDDFMMNTAEPCSDNNPNCGECPLATSCQANCDSAMTNLKMYFT